MTRPRKKYLVIISEDEKYPMKQWLRDNPEFIPEGMHPDHTVSPVLARGLERNGCDLQETDTEIHVIIPFEDDEEDAVTPSAFALEHHLRDFIVKKIKEDDIDFNGRRLKLYQTSDGRDGVEYPTDTGRIDILAVSTDDENQEYFVIELKLSRGSYQAIGQLMSYMSWVKDEIADGNEVNGIIVAQSIDDRLKRAARMMCSRVELYEYELIFDLDPVSLTN